MNTSRKPMEPLLSVITINKNNIDGLRKTLASVAEQKRESVEYVVIDGGSDDLNLEVLSGNAATIDVLVSEPDGGIYHAMNKGVQRSSGLYCLFLNSGDWLVEGSLGLLLEALSSGGDIVYGDMKAVFPDRVLDYPLPKMVSPRFFFSSTINHQSCAIRRDLLLARPYDESLVVFSDWDWFLNASLADRQFVHAGISIAYFDMGGVSGKMTQQADDDRRRLIGKALPKSIQADFAFIGEILGSEWFSWKDVADRHPIARKLLILILRALRKVDHIKRRHADGKKYGGS
jgi:glycosyltransferase involved in cell wall biosynthesis